MPDSIESPSLDNMGDTVEDATEETFLLFSQGFTDNDLGVLDSKASYVDLEIAGRDYKIQQSSSLLHSSRKAGTTGAMLWKITPLIAEWLADETSILWSQCVLDSSSIVIELGCGIAGLIGLVLAQRVATYVLTDQEYVMNILKANLVANQKPTKPGKAPRKGSKATAIDADSHIITSCLDWEHDSVQNLCRVLPNIKRTSLLILCDCVYNTYLIEPLVQVCKDICDLATAKRTVLLIAQQLRTDDVFEAWLSALLRYFIVYRMTDEHLPAGLRGGSGYAVHLAVLKS